MQIYLSVVSYPDRKSLIIVFACLRVQLLHKQLLSLRTNINGYMEGASTVLIEVRLLSLILFPLNRELNHSLNIPTIYV